MTLPAEEPALEVPEMDDLLGKGGLIDPCRQIFQLGPCLGDLSVPGPVESTVGNKMLNFRQLSGIKPDPVFVALVDQDTRNPAKILSVHYLSAPYTGDVVVCFLKRFPQIRTLEIVISINFILSRRKMKFVPVKPKAPAFRAEIVFFIAVQVNIEPDVASWTHRLPGLEIFMEMTAAQGADGITTVYFFPAILASSCILHSFIIIIL
jgi:hypothetical protein